MISELEERISKIKEEIKKIDNDLSKIYAQLDAIEYYSKKSRKQIELEETSMNLEDMKGKLSSELEELTSTYDIRIRICELCDDKKALEKKLASPNLNKDSYGDILTQVAQINEEIHRLEKMIKNNSR